MLAMLEHLAKPWVFVRNARMVFIKSTKVKKNVLNVRWGKCTAMLKPSAVVVTLVGLAALMVFVQNARLVFIKIPKGKRSALTLVPRLEKNPTTKARGVNCHRGVPAKWANI